MKIDELVTKYAFLTIGWFHTLLFWDVVASLNKSRWASSFFHQESYLTYDTPFLPGMRVLPVEIVLG